MATPAQNVKLPVKFAVETRFNNRVGFCLVRTDQDRGTDTYDILLRENSDNRFYNIETYVPLNTPAYIQNIKKRQEHRVHWSYTMKQLKYNQTVIPILKFTPKVHLPAIATWNFVPIVERGQTPAQPPAPAPIPPIVEAKLPIKEIPNHAIRLLLLGAVIEGEECPISGTAIDATNGSVTSCFHLFERDSIARWLALPHTNKKCPVCMQACDLYILP
jgi:hypothetical protein